MARKKKLDNKTLEKIYHDYYYNQLSAEKLELKYKRKISSMRILVNRMRREKGEKVIRNTRALEASPKTLRDLYNDYFIKPLSYEELTKKYRMEMVKIRNVAHKLKKEYGGKNVQRIYTFRNKVKMRVPKPVNEPDFKLTRDDEFFENLYRDAVIKKLSMTTLIIKYKMSKTQILDVIDEMKD
ncbi:MAG: hypothetical protein HQL32_01215 [Planctomycetes bacterium]|nr:hypothetical protein [Planctomycetota bacterium]